MKKILILVAPLLLLVWGCQKTDITNELVQQPQITERRCASYEVLQEQLKEDPSLKQRMEEIERFTTRFQSDPSLARISGDSMIISVVVNVIYNTTAQNISLSQIQSQIAVLNEDYKGINSDITKVPSTFTGVKAGDTKIRFVLDSVRRKSTTKTSWTTNDAVKKTAQGGLDPLSPTTKLNLWVCNLSNGILGYAQFPGGSSATDGVVILYSAFGSKSKYATGTYTTTYNLGRTATHEVGHWLNLRHIWGDATCGDDLVGDTPLHNTANYGCPVAGHKSTCTGTPIEMTMNYMDYTDDACMYMFSSGQKTRMQATYAIGGPRASFR